MKLASACIDCQVMRISRIQDDVVGWWNKCLLEKSFCTPPNAYGIDFDGLNDALSHNSDPDD
jgi:hypothetical protein